MHIDDSIIHVHNKRAMRVNVGTGVSSEQKELRGTEGNFRGSPVSCYCQRICSEWCRNNVTTGKEDIIGW
jgi:hypothetical protein